MKENRLFFILTTFSTKEWRDFSRFVHSPFFNRQQALCQLIDFLKKQAKSLPSNALIFKHLYPNKKYEDVRVRVLLSNLYKLVEQYLVHAKLMDDDLQQNISLLEIYKDLKLPDYFERTATQLSKQLEEFPYRDPYYFKQLSQLQLQQLRFYMDNKEVKNFPFQEASDHIDVAYITLKLQEICRLLSHQTIYKANYDFGLLEAILNYIESRQLIQTPAIAVYYHCYHLMREIDSDQHFKELKQLIFAKNTRFPSEELHYIYLVTINFCIKKFNQGNRDYAFESHQLFQKGLEKNYLFANGVLSRFTYTNIASMGIVVHEYDWVEQFLHDYKEHIEKKYRKDTFMFNLARLTYERKDYDSAQQLLYQADYSDLLMSLAAKALLLKIYYEQEEYDLLESHLSAMSIFIRRKHNLGYHRNLYKQLIHYTKKLLELNPYKSEKKTALAEEIKNTKGIAEQSWLLRQLNSVSF